MGKSRVSSQEPSIVNRVGTFWSYVHRDDHDGRLSQLARDLVTEYEMITGDQLDLFVDKDGIEWGDRWRVTIDDNIAERMSFIAVLSPRFFRSPECRRELTSFIEGATNLGLRELLLPLYYVECASIEDKDPADDLAKKVKEFQYEDWRDLRLADSSSEPYRRGVNKLASRLAKINQRAEQCAATRAATAATATETASGSEDADEEDFEGDIDEEGTLDRLATMEEALPEWSTILTRISEETKLTAGRMATATSDLKRHEKSTFKHKRSIARRLAKEMSAPVDRMVDLVLSFVDKTYNIDAGMRVLIPQAAAEMVAAPEHRETYMTVFDQIRELSETMDDALGQAEYAAGQIEKMEMISRDLRPVVRRWRETLMTMVEARSIVGGWIEYLDDAGTVHTGRRAELTEPTHES